MKNQLIAILAFLTTNAVLYIAFHDVAYKGSWILFILLLCATAIILSVVIITGIIHIATLLIKKELIGKHFLLTGFKWVIVCTVLLIAQIGISEFFTYIPQTSPIAYEKTIDVNDSNQVITVRGTDETNPIILFLAGGPGGSQVQATRMKLKDLEDTFTIVTWEQPGSGKSYTARNITDLTKETYFEDGHAVTQYLQTTFSQDKIYLMGESWGSYLAVQLASLYPEDYHAIVTTGQMVDFAETEVYCFNKAYDIAVQRQDQQQIEALDNLNEVPLTEGNISLDSATYLMYLHSYMNSLDEVYKTDYDTFDSLLSPEYSITDSFNFIRALLNTFSHVYKQLYEEDLRETNTTLEVPIYILQGVHDVNAPNYLVQDYYNQIVAPDKALIWFEHSGHSAWITENELFAQTVKDLLLD